MARTSVSSYIAKSSSYPSSGYGYHLGNYASTYATSYTKPNFDYARPCGSSSYRARNGSTSGYARNTSNYTSSLSTGRSSLARPLQEPKFSSGLSVDCASRHDRFGSKLRLSSPTSRYSSGYTSTGLSRDRDRTYGRFSQERTVDVSRDFRELSLGPQLPSLRRSSSQLDLMSSRASVERSSVGRDAAVDRPSEIGSRVTPRVHPTMGMYSSERASERHLGGNSEMQANDNDQTDREGSKTRYYGGYKAGRKSPTPDYDDNDAADVKRSREKMYSSFDRFSIAKTAVVPNSVNTRKCSGLRNIGNTCFMNSVLQCLAHTQQLLEYFLESNYLAEINREGSRTKGVLIAAYAELMNSMWNGLETVVSPTKFKCEVAQFAKLFMGYNQQDAQEFLLYLLQGLHEDINRVREKNKRQIVDSNEVETISASEKARKSWKEHLEIENSKIVDLFEGQLKSALTCTECGYVSNTFDPTLGLSLPIKKSYGEAVSLVDCLELFTQEEVLDGHERTMCARCKKKQKSTKKLSIQKFPQILIINLKRFNDEHSYRSKLSTEVKCPLRNLDLKMFAAEKMAGSIVYELYAVSNHSGTPSGGHYTAAARDPFSREWHYFNDHRVSATSESEVVTSEAYILFYELSSGSLSN